MPPRKLVLAVQDPDLRAKLEAVLRAEHVDVEYVPGLEDAEPTAIEADVVVMHADGLSSPELPAVLERGGEGDAPGVVVVSEEEQPEEEVRLVAAGATAVLDLTEERASLAEQLVDLAAAEMEGGLHGPEAAGAVAEPKLADFQSRSPRMRDFLDVVKRVTASDSTLLVTGETGVGKERLARAIHAESARSSGPFIAVNCGALPENLLESELFGHERGAFTGATSARKGRFEAADGGTILLDEVGEMPTHLQVKLLTVLQRREVQRLGAREIRPIDVRVLAATNRDLAAEVSDGRFREDLLFRLNVISLVIPPLRERTEDLPWLIGRFLRHFAAIHDRSEVRGIGRRAMDALLAYSWPGNVRELVNVIERAVLLCDGERVVASNLPEAVLRREVAGPGEATTADQELLELPLQEARRRLVEGFEHGYLSHHLRCHRGMVGEVARHAGINPRTLYEKMRRLGLQKEDFR